MSEVLQRILAKGVNARQYEAFASNTNLKNDLLTMKLQMGAGSQGSFWNRGIINEFRQNLGTEVSLV